MQINYSLFILMCLLLIIKVGIVIVFINDKVFKYVTIIVLTALFIYSGVGLNFFPINEFEHFVIQFELFSSLFLILMIGYSYIKIDFNIVGTGINKLEKTIINVPILSIMYIFTFIFVFIYPSFRVGEIFNIFDAFSNYRVPSFMLKQEQKQDMVYMLVTSQLRVVLLPFFYIHLYTYRKNVLKFLCLYFIPIYLKFMNTNYISRNEILIHFLFILFYLLIEKKIDRKKIILILVCSLPILINLFYQITFVRVGIEGGDLSVKQSLEKLVVEETNYVRHYPILSEITSQVTLSSFILYLLLLPIPSSVINLFVVYNPPEMARILTKVVTGLSYGDRNYYLLLPSVLGEGILVFDENLAFLYSIFLATFLSLFIKILKSDARLKYLLLFFGLDVLRQMRGGSQYIFSSWINTLVPFFIILLLLNGKSRKEDKFC